MPASAVGVERTYLIPSEARNLVREWLERGRQGPSLAALARDEVR
jgi:hypothetical protein